VRNFTDVSHWINEWCSQHEEPYYSFVNLKEKDNSADTSPKNKSRKRKPLQILGVPKERDKLSQEQQIPAKPERFLIHSKPIAER